MGIMEGLSQQMAGGMSQGMPQQPQQGQMMPSVQEVAALLMQGIPPEELMKMGVPQEVIMQAIQMIEGQMAQEQMAVAPKQEGAVGLSEMM
jgi:hypothetical protein